MIDIGTVKAKCLVASFDRTGRLCTDYSSATLTCFGCDMVNDSISNENLERTIAELQRCKQILDKEDVCAYRVVSTHAMRRAKNRVAVTERILRETGFVVDNLSSEQEAALFFRAALQDFPPAQRYAVVDMGGGSMQVIIGRRSRPEQMYLLPTGSVSLHEKFTRNPQLETGFNTPEDISRMRKYILTRLKPVPLGDGLPIIYGSTNVLDMMQAVGLPLEHHPDSASHPYRTHAAHLDTFIETVLPLTFAEREARYPFQKGYMWGIDKAFLNITALARRLGSPYIVPTNANVAQGLVYTMARSGLAK